MSTKRSVPFEFFRPNEFMYFDTGRLAAFEKEIGNVAVVKVMQDIEENICSIGFILAACRIGLAHHYPNRPGAMEEAMDRYVDGGGLLLNPELLKTINRAFLATGLFGRAVADKAVRNETMTEEEVAEEVKNAETASE